MVGERGPWSFTLRELETPSICDQGRAYLKLRKAAKLIVLRNEKIVAETCLDCHQMAAVVAP